MNMAVHCRNAALVAGAAAMLAACGDQPGATATPPATAQIREPSIELGNVACEANLHDSGNVLYVILDTHCPETAGGAFTFVERAGDSVRSHVLDFPGLGVTTTVEFAVVGRRDITFFKAGKWREIPNLDSWQARDGAGLLIKDGYAYLLGGWLAGPVTNEVWRSSDLVNWEFLGFAPWPARHGSAWLAHDNRLFVIGGDMYDDVWSSADGIEWRVENASAPFGKRYSPNAVSMGGRLIVYAGLRWHPQDWCVPGQLDCTVTGYDDVWQSLDDGRTWERILEHAPWPGRGLIHGSIVHDGEIFLIGGGLKVVPPGEQFNETVAEMTDIWSSADGRTWTQRAATLPFPARTHFSVASTSFGCVVSDGSVGVQDNFSNDLYIASDCLSFEAVPDPPLQPRHASSVAEFNGTLVILGGNPSRGAGPTIWQYAPGIDK
jgi:hypothetical protein